MYKLAFVILSCVATVALGAVGIYRAEEKPAEFANQEGCYLKSLNRVLPYNKPYYPQDNSCSQYICGTNNETRVFSCGAVAAAGNCKVVAGDLSKQYPDCCKTIKCDPTTPAPTTTQAPTTTEKPAPEKPVSSTSSACSQSRQLNEAEVLETDAEATAGAS